MSKEEEVVEGFRRVSNARAGCAPKGRGTLLQYLYDAM